MMHLAFTRRPVPTPSPGLAAFAPSAATGP